MGIASGQQISTAIREWEDGTMCPCKVLARDGSDLRLQVNPYGYKGANAPSTSFGSEADYDTALLDRCSSLGIEVIAVTDH